MGRGQNKVFKMGGHDGQPIPKLVGHLLHLLGHSTEPRSLAISSLCLYNWEYKCKQTVLGTKQLPTKYYKYPAIGLAARQQPIIYNVCY